MKNIISILLLFISILSILPCGIQKYSTKKFSGSFPIEKQQDPLEEDNTFEWETKFISTHTNTDITLNLYNIDAGSKFYLLHQSIHVVYWLKTFSTPPDLS